MGVPSAARMPPWVLRIRNSLRPSFDGSQPIPASILKPNRSPDGRSINMWGVMGSDPCGPGALLRTSYNEGSCESKMSDIQLDANSPAQAALPHIQRYDIAFHSGHDHSHRLDTRRQSGGNLDIDLIHPRVER